ncbi:phosphoribosylamine--glycine ligase [Zopfia rhizophila CBS 207.26]|uniref:phosphoribosylamine--glycine ligase n=1 Tax=Zopfia rhizophila CBS 207.26 TaxID=1314779 RepID=A0A6A6DSN4_9PEZI|nr:phosphoribosylamine--glycine ligase [Zopfia rhizophila CBS 207.26]
MSPDKLRILLVGNGGREHAIAWKLTQSPRVEHIFAVPGNGGTAQLPNITNISTIKQEDFAALAQFARENSVNLLVPGPEAPLVAGIVDYFRKNAEGIRCFGPSEAAARMEGSKTFSKDFMKRHNIPTAAYENFSSYDKASAYLDSVSHSVVIKASGLAAGKGVIIPQTKEEAHAALKEIMLDKEFGVAGDEVVIEEFLEGDELSILSFSDGTTIRSLPPAQDHKRIGDGDTGPNTGGMGTYAPTRIAPESVVERIHREVLQPTIDGMKAEGFPFTGVLFTGLMMTKDGPKVLEYNVRFGDPETQSLLPLTETDLAEIMLACTDGKLAETVVKVSPKSGATVVVAAGGYPGSYAKGTVMQLDEVPKDVVLFHAGTTFADKALKTSGGRVIASTAIADTLEEAVSKAYTGVNAIHFEGMQFRKDIAGRALKK